LSIKQLNKPKHSNDRVYSETGDSPALNTMGGGMRQPFINLNNKKTTIRRLTPTECERLQGFPDGWTEGQSDTQRYKQLGNAVTVNVVQEVGKKIYDLLHD
jgi:DNA (cytosine-5)-methyltransferase 1